MKSKFAFTKEETRFLVIVAFIYWFSYVLAALQYGYPIVFTLWTQSPYVLTDLIACYAVYRWISPEMHGKIGLLVVKQLLLFVVYFGCYRGLNFLIPEYNSGERQIVVYSISEDLFTSFIVLLTAILPAYGLYYYKYGMYQAEKANEKRVQFATLNEQFAKQELRHYKGEFNAHYTFNILTYLHSKAIKLPELAEPILLLTDILRYNTTVASDQAVSLDTEITNLTNFITLNRLIHPHHYIRLEITGSTDSIMVYPRIIMGFIENAIKHGDASDPDFPIIIHISAEESVLVIQVSNKIRKIPIRNTTKKGIPITKTMLNRLYGKHHNLLIEEVNDIFKIRLDLPKNDQLLVYSLKEYETIH
ncbi:MAG: histidine kinase [Cyclobacteriaceae bacterium]